MKHYLYMALVGTAFAIAVVLINRKTGVVDSLLAKVGVGAAKGAANA